MLKPKADIRIESILLYNIIVIFLCSLSVEQKNK